MSFVNNGKYTIYFEEEGSGYPLLFIHGNGESSQIFYEYKKELSKQYRIILMDSRGHGKSSGGESKLYFKDMASDALKVLDELNIEKCNIVGYSDGASIGLELAIHNPTRINKLMLVGANYSPKGMKIVPLMAITISYIFLTVVSLFCPRLSKKAHQFLLMLNQPKFKKEELEGINLPILNIYGENDLIKRKHSQELTKLVKGEEIMVTRAGHDGIIKLPELFLSMINSFIGN